MLPGLRTPDGALYISTAAPTATDPRNGGVCMTPAGQVKVSISVPQTFDQGKGFRLDGALCIDKLGTAIASFVGGIPYTASGAMKCIDNRPVLPTDYYVGGLRVGVLAGVYVTEDPVPVGTGFSNGFSNGFGD